MNNSKNTSRRQFSKTALGLGAATFGFQVVPSRVFGANSKIQLAGIGSGGKGTADINGSLNVGCHLTALVDVIDAKNLKFSSDTSSKKLKSRLGAMTSNQQKWSDARFFTDYREMFETMGDKIDAITVSTPDHHHFHASVMAMKRGIHVYCQKPLTHGIWEARTLTELAAQTGVKTQMGNQAHANSHMRRVVELLRAGVLGKVTEVHAWTNRPIWAQGFSETPPAETPPTGIDWEQWVGPAPWVDYSSKIAPFAWRGWWNYGTGALGDMACHIMDLPYWGLGLTSPKTVIAKEEGGTELSAPINSSIIYDFANEGVKFHWYDGQKEASFDQDNWRLNPGEFNRPSEDILEGMDYRQYGSVIIGEHGKLFFHRKNQNWVVKPSSVLSDLESWPKQSIPRARGDDNYAEWVDAIHGKVERGQSDFAYAGPFTETILLGCVAQQNPGEVLKWNPKDLSFRGRPDLDSTIKRAYRKGWEIEV
ncbi:MAG: Gfo/Idh/MocA family oxidoreductase [Verrucomicrobiota bacterium]